MQPTTTSRSDQPARTIRFTDRVACPHHGPVMVLVRHVLGPESRVWVGRGSVTFYRCTGTVSTPLAILDRVPPTGSPRFDNHGQCLYMRPNKYQKRPKGERHK